MPIYVGRVQREAQATMPSPPPSSAGDLVDTPALDLGDPEPQEPVAPVRAPAPPPETQEQEPAAAGSRRISPVPAAAEPAPAPAPQQAAVPPAAPTLQEPAGAPPSPYQAELERLRSVAGAADDAFLASFRAAMKADPDLAGKAQRLAARLGQPTAAVEADIEVARTLVQERAVREMDLAQAHPNVFRALQDNDFLRLAHDDLDNLIATDTVFDMLGRQWRAGQQQVERGELGVRAALGTITPQERVRLAEVETQLGEAGRDSGFLASATQVLGQMSATLPKALGVGAAAALPTAMGGPVSAGAAFTWGTGAALFAQSAQIEGGNAYLDLLAQHVDPDTAATVALGVGLVNGALELVGAKFAAAPFQAVVRQMGRGVVEGLTRQTAGTALRTFLTEYAKAIGGEVSTEVLQEITNIAGEAVARPEGQPEPSWRELRDRVGQVAGKTFQAMALLAAPGPGMHLANQMRLAARASEQAQAFGAAVELFGASKVRERNPAAAEAFADQVAGAAGVDTLYVEAKEFTAAMDRAGVSRADLQRDLPEVFRQLENADADDSAHPDVTIPTGSFLSRLTKTALGAELLPHVRMGAGEMSVAESRRLQDEQKSLAGEAGRLVREQRVEDDDFRRSGQTVEEAMYAQVAATQRLPVPQARAAARFYRSFVDTQARRIGTSPEEFVRRYPLTVVAAAQGAAKQADTLSQRSTETPEFRQWFRESKVVDSAGDPLVVYHATSSDFQSFKTPAFFSDDVDYVEAYAIESGATATIPAYLSIANPMVVDMSPREFADPLVERPLIERAKAGGYDGLILRDAGSGGRFYVALDPSQIKSTSNRAPTRDPNILHAARGGFDPVRLTALLYEKADLSTFLHETSHYFLTVLADLAAQPNAPADIVGDMDALLAWFGVADLQAWNAMSLEQQRAAHEQFAYGFESYLFDGAAPSLQLRSLFDRFVEWLRTIYRDIRGQLNDAYRREFGRDLPILTGEVRQVMDRLLASQDQIAAAEAVRDLVPLFQTQEQSGMTDAQWAEYQQLQQEARAAAEGALTRDSLAQLRWVSAARSRILRELQGQQNALRSKIRREVVAELQATPAAAALRWLRAGEVVGSDGKVEVDDQPHKMSRDEVRVLLGLTPKLLDPLVDRPGGPKKKRAKRGVSLVTRIRQLGGISWESWHRTYPGERRGEFKLKGVVRGRRGGGMSWDRMAAALQSEDYGPGPTQEGQVPDHSWLIEALTDAANGTPWFPTTGEADVGIVEVDRTEPEPADVAAARKAAQAQDDAEDAAIRAANAAVPTADPEAAIAQIDDLLVDGMLAVPAEAVAERFGFATAADLVRDLLRINRFDEAVAQRTDERMLAEHDELADQRGLDLAVERALHGEARARFVSVELRHLQKAERPIREMLAAAKEAARQAIGAMTLREAVHYRFAQAEARARRNAIGASKDGDSEAAVRWKRTEMLQHALAAAALEAQAQADKAVRALDRFKRADDKLAKVRNTDLVNAARWVLSRFNLGTPTQEANAQRAIDAIRAYNPALYSEFEPLLLDAAQGSRDYRDLTVTQFRDLMATVDALWWQSKRVREIEIDGAKLQRSEAIDEMLRKAASLDPKSLPGESQAVTTKERAGMRLMGTKAWLRRIEHWATKMDGGAPGPWTRFIWRQLRKQVDEYRHAKNNYLRRLRDLVLQLDQHTGKIAAPEIGYTFNGRRELIGALLHIGNRSNLNKLLAGLRWTDTDRSGQPVFDDDGYVSTAKWDRLLDRLIRDGVITKKDFDFVQAVWDLNEEIKPQAQKTHRELFGFYFEEVAAQPIRTKWGVYRGGYVPAKVDPELAPEARQREVQGGSLEDIGQAVRDAFPSTGKGFTISRLKGYNRPLQLDVRLQVRHLDEVLRFVHLQAGVTDVLSILRDQRFAQAVNRIDPTVIGDMLMPWLERTARQQMATSSGNAALDWLFSFLRRTTGMGIMFGNLVNAAQQITGISNAAQYVAPRFLRRAAWQTRGGFGAERIARLSRYMDARLRDQVGGVVDEIEQSLSPSWWGRVQRWTSRHAYFAQQFMQNRVDVVTWQAAFDQAMERAGAGLDDQAAVAAAVDEADGVVRQAQGSQTPEDVARYEAGTPFSRLFTQFSGYFNAVLNQIASAPGMSGKARAAALSLIVPGVVAAAIQQALAGGWDDEDDDGYVDEVASWFFLTQTKAALALAPGVGPAISSLVLTDRPGDRLALSPVFSTLQSSVRGGAALFDRVAGNRAALKGRDVRDLLTALSILMGLPVSVAGRTAGYAIDVENGRTQPSSAADYVRGLLVGR